jgi:hypothetical protein
LRIAAERGLPLHGLNSSQSGQTASKEPSTTTKEVSSKASSVHDHDRGFEHEGVIALSAQEPFQLPSPLPTDEEEEASPAPNSRSRRSTRSSSNDDGLVNSLDELE